MAEEDIPVEIESVSLEDTDDTVVADAGTNNIIPLLWKSIIVLMTIVNKMNNDG